jgi:Asp-tRNA(Asn)/Glu-tRNA(Gln) amidotransferase B subunit
MGFFVGQVMKRSGGKADPKGVQPVLQQRLG